MSEHSPDIAAIIAKINEEKAQPRPDKKRLLSLLKQIRQIEDGVPITPEKERRSNVPAPRPRLAESPAEMADAKPVPLPQGAAFEDDEDRSEIIGTVDPISDDELNRRLGWEDDDVLTVDESKSQAAQMGELFIQLLRWCDTSKPDLTAKKLKVLRYCLAPHEFHGATMADLAIASGCGKQDFDQFASKLRARFNIEPVVGRSKQARANIAKGHAKASQTSLTSNHPTSGSEGL